MKNISKIISLILIGVCIMTLFSGCGNSKDNKKETPKNDDSAFFTDKTLKNSPIQPNGLFKSFMVLQREKQVPVWGTANEDKNGQEITVTFDGQTKTTKIEDNKWSVNLDAMPANKKGNEMIIACGDDKIKFTNVQVGEVWLASGQSNMAFFIEYLQGETKTNIKNDCDYPDIKMFVTPELMSDEKVDSINDAKWLTVSPLNIEASHFSTIAFLFARKLHKELDVPVGMICSSFGGTRIETWIPNEKLIDSKLPVYGGIQSNNAYNSMINPHIPYAFRGMIWYQGEGNCFPPDHNQYYSDYLKLMVDNAREKFNNPDMPFIQVGLPSYGKSDADFTNIRFEQMEADENNKNVYTTTNFDTGNPDDIHPSDKLFVGIRVATMALEKVYGSNKVDNNYPTAESAKVDGKSVIVTFKNCDKGLDIKQPEVNGLEICGADGKYYQATAEVIDNKNIKVSSSKVSKPTGVRYACKSNMLPVHFIGKNLLPVKPFKITL